MLSRLRSAIAIFSLCVFAPLVSPAAETAGASPAETTVAVASRAVAPAAIGKSSAPSPTVLFAQDFTHSATVPNAWLYGGGACLTAGYSATPSTSIPACGSQAPYDKGGSGALQLTPAQNWVQGYAIYATHVSTAAGLVVKFDYYSYGNTVGNIGDGFALIFGYENQIATMPGGCCGSLEYAPWTNGQITQPGLSNGWLAVGLEEDGWWTCTCNGKVGGSPNPTYSNIITVRGSAQSGWNYLTSSVNSAGVPGSLPFSLTAGHSYYRPVALSFTVTLTPAGVLSVAIDRHNGQGSVTYLPPTEIVGLNGEPAVPANVVLGFAAGNGNANERHQLGSVSVTTL